jgi:hypothetical protein
MKKTLQNIGLNSENSIVIGSGILQALGVRKSEDIDLVVSQETYDSLKKSGKFTVTRNRGREIIVNDMFEIGTDWVVLGKLYGLEELKDNSIVIDGVRYITIRFLYKVKKNWLSQNNVRKKDIEDVELIKKYLGEL